ncbi:hypothetical protein PUNSTDRAFT_135389 [Punctularia strigosozonata HHB-11173 SS5]|uniref:uncharacterized protein n=1 Tax=Punctularia strigosozonata (strain HHB-11173) TaxID=741275 RepID=UPI00044176A5|nr:uncharacterized protein PUNSTDRAFT_135389 [Punctularia strigosozonata HHB-11173 SS5]EIN07871.1 hypothetical protein PUNSTDRAFT_135389 [Punctularia strigosozonata HHB-11173 SS5]
MPGSVVQILLCKLLSSPTHPFSSRETSYGICIMRVTTILSLSLFVVVGYSLPAAPRPWQPHSRTPLIYRARRDPMANSRNAQDPPIMPTPTTSPGVTLIPRITSPPPTATFDASQYNHGGQEGARNPARRPLKFETGRLRKQHTSTLVVS